MGKNWQLLTLLAALDALLVTDEDKNFASGCHSTPSPLPHTWATELDRRGCTAIDVHANYGDASFYALWKYLADNWKWFKP